MDVEWNLETINVEDVNIKNALRSFPDMKFNPQQLDIAEMAATAPYERVKDAGKAFPMSAWVLLPGPRQQANVAVGHVSAHVEVMLEMKNKTTRTIDVLNGIVSEQEEEALELLTTLNVDMTI